MAKICNKITLLIQNTENYSNEKINEINYLSQGIGKKEFKKMQKGLKFDKHKNKEFLIFKLKNKDSFNSQFLGRQFMKKRPHFIFIHNNKKYKKLVKIIHDKKKGITIKMVLLSRLMDMERMFYSCNTLISISCNSKWINSKIINMKEMFFGCTSLESLPDISLWNTKEVKSMERVFCDCSSLTF